jgi:hypothetical protein
MKYLLAAFLASLVLSASSLPVQAAELSIEAPLASAGSTILLPVVFTADAASVNVVEGSIAVPDGMVIESIDASGSAFPLFASGPTYMPSSRTVEFTAGSESGVAPHETALLFVIHARAEKEATYVLVPGLVTAYARDGVGTKVAVSAQKTQVSVGAKGSAQVDALPEGPARALLAEVGKDESLFEGRWFATFLGGENGTPLARYEVREGWWRLPETAERYYVLKDQSLHTTVWVTAVDERGGRVTTMIPAAHPWTERVVLLALSLLAALCAYLAHRKLRTL